MQLTKTLTSLVAAGGLVGAIGLAYAQATDPAQPAPSTTPMQATTPADPATTPAPMTPPVSSDPAATPPATTDGSTLPAQQDRN